MNNLQLFNTNISSKEILKHLDFYKDNDIDYENNIYTQALIFRLYKSIVNRLNKAHENKDVKKLCSILSKYEYLNVVLGMDMYLCLMNHFSTLYQDLINNKEKNTKTYIVLDTTKGYYKIGKTTQDVKDRIRQWSSLACAELCKPLVINRDVENELHREFKDKRIKGEWFELSFKDIDYIKEKYL